uniref:Uncharacterized protein n=1 Tax=Labrus bergylta TaxID=56723 RepID=A0A3Q3FWU5_9LABR
MTLITIQSNFVSKSVVNNSQNTTDDKPTNEDYGSPKRTCIHTNVFYSVFSSDNKQMYLVSCRHPGSDLLSREN